MSERKIYRANDFAAGFGTEPGTMALQMYAIIIMFCVFVAYAIYRMPDRSLFFDPAMQAIMEISSGGIAKLVLVTVCTALLIVLIRSYTTLIALDFDQIEAWKPIDEKFFNRLNFLAQKKIVLKFDLIERLVSDMRVAPQGALFTTIEKGNSSLEIIVGSIGYFSILEAVENKTTNAEWDESTRFILRRHREGRSVKSIEREFYKNYQEKLKQIEPSWWKRGKLERKALRENEAVYANRLLAGLKGMELKQSHGDKDCYEQDMDFFEWFKSRDGRSEFYRLMIGGYIGLFLVLPPTLFIFIDSILIALFWGVLGSIGLSLLFTGLIMLGEYSEFRKLSSRMVPLNGQDDKEAD